METHLHELMVPRGMMVLFRTPRRILEKLILGTRLSEVIYELFVCANNTARAVYRSARTWKSTCAYCQRTRAQWTCEMYIGVYIIIIRAFVCVCVCECACASRISWHKMLCLRVQRARTIVVPLYIMFIVFCVCNIITLL